MAPRTRPPAHLRAVERRPEQPGGPDAFAPDPPDPEREIGDAFDRLDALLGDREPRP